LSSWAANLTGESLRFRADGRTVVVEPGVVQRVEGAAEAER
jgi:hypothetical protein